MAEQPPDATAQDVAATLIKLFNRFPSALGPLSNSAESDHGTPSAAPIHSLSQLSDGVSLFYFLHSLEPSYFDTDALSLGLSFSDPTPATQAGRRGNVQYLLDCLETFFEANLNATMGRRIDMSHVDAEVLARGGAMGDVDESQIVSLMELVLLCAINSGGKESVIGEIMSMDDAEQQTLMMVINEIMNRGETTTAPSSNDALNSSIASLTSTPRKQSAEAMMASSPAFARNLLQTPSSTDRPSGGKMTVTPSSSSSSSDSALVTSLRQENASLIERVDALQREVREWRGRAHTMEEEMEAMKKSNETSQSNAIEAAKSELEHSLRDAHKTELARVTKDLSRASNRISELEDQLSKTTESMLTNQREKQTLSERLEERQSELMHLHDELHVLQSKNEELSSLQAKFDKLRSRMDELDELRANYAALETENSKQLDRIIELENENREVDTLKDQLQRMKDRNMTSENQLLDRTVAFEEVKQQLEVLKENLNAAVADKKAAMEEVRTMKNEMESLKKEARAAAAATATGTTSTTGGEHVRLSSLSGFNNADVLDSTSLASDSDTDPRRLTAELTRLRSELSKLHSQQSELESMRSERDQLHATKEMLQKKYLEVQRKVTQLQQTAENGQNEREDELRRREEEIETLKARLQTFHDQANAETEKEKNQARELEALREENSQLMEQLEAARTSTATTTTSSSNDTSLPAASSPSKSVAALTTELDESRERNKKLEAYIRNLQKKFKLQEESQTRTHEQLQALHESYKHCRTLLIERERELVEKEKNRQSENVTAARERKLMSAAFYSLGMEYQSAVLTGRAVSKNVTASPHGRSWLNQQRQAAANQAM